MWHPGDLDTRTKIVDWPAAVEHTRHQRTVVVTGYFDPLLAEHARRLRELRTGFEALIVVVSELPDPVLDGPARAQLLASLENVDWVVPAGGFEPNGGAVVYYEELPDRTRFERLVKHVRERHQRVMSH